ncbi:hypothetical protein [Fimbriiglobus ruber]|nr:hypothetical protein [Fimbriiglobus ruber]
MKWLRFPKTHNRRENKIALGLTVLEARENPDAGFSATTAAAAVAPYLSQVPAGIAAQLDTLIAQDPALQQQLTQNPAAVLDPGYQTGLGTLTQQYAVPLASSASVQTPATSAAGGGSAAAVDAAVAPYLAQLPSDLAAAVPNLIATNPAIEGQLSANPAAVTNPGYQQALQQLAKLNEILSLSSTAAGATTAEPTASASSVGAAVTNATVTPYLSQIPSDLAAVVPTLVATNPALVQQLGTNPAAVTDPEYQQALRILAVESGLLPSSSLPPSASEQAPATGASGGGSAATADAAVASYLPQLPSDLAAVVPNLIATNPALANQLATNPAAVTDPGYQVALQHLAEAAGLLPSSSLPPSASEQAPATGASGGGSAATADAAVASYLPQLPSDLAAVVPNLIATNPALADQLATNPAAVTDPGYQVALQHLAEAAGLLPSGGTSTTGSTTATSGGTTTNTGDTSASSGGTSGSGSTSGTGTGSQSGQSGYWSAVFVDSNGQENDYGSEPTQAAAIQFGQQEAPFLPGETFTNNAKFFTQ